MLASSVEWVLDQEMEYFHTLEWDQVADAVCMCYYTVNPTTHWDVRLTFIAEF